MIAVPYDISSFAVDEQTEGDIIFTFLSSRNITLTEAKGWVETNPSDNITGTLSINDVEITGSSVSISTLGNVSITFSSDINLIQGDILRIILNADAAIPATKVGGVAVTFKGTFLADNEDDRYDISFFLEGRIPANITISAAVVARQITIFNTDFYVEQGTNQETSTLVFIVRNNGVQIGTITTFSSGTGVLNLTDSPYTLDEDDILSIFAPGSLTFVDSFLQDMSITIKGFLGQA